MSTLVKDIETLKKNNLLSSDFKFETLQPFVRKQERKHIKSLLGPALYAAWVAVTPVEPTAKEAFELFQEASSNLATLEYTKVGIVVPGKSGFLIATGADNKPAEWWQIRDLRRSLLSSGMEAIDEALQLMEDNQDKFPTWIESEGFIQFQELFTRQTKEFQTHFNINNSRLTFQRLRPGLLKVENKFFESLLGSETVLLIKTGSTPEAKKALEICQAAQVSLCISEMAMEGAYNLTPAGFSISIEDIPGEKLTQLTEKDLYNLHRVKENDGIEHLRRLTDYLREKPTIFIAFSNKEKTATPSIAHNTTSTVSF